MIEMFEFKDANEASLYAEKWDAALVGDVCDDRTTSSKDYALKHCDSLIHIKYCSDELEILANNKKYQCYEIPEFIKSLNVKKILLDATTLGVVEIGLLLKHLHATKKIKCSILYVEPGAYVKKRVESVSAINEREFDLSMELIGFKGIPSLTKAIDIKIPNNVIFFLGFESYRLKNALEALNISPKECSLVFGVPSYQSGWETNAFDNNIKCINDHDLGGRIYFCGADNPSAVFEELKRIRINIGDDSEMTIVPIGSKPHAIGALTFMAGQRCVNMLYDHPIKSKNRTDSVGAFHLYKLVR